MARLHLPQHDDRDHQGTGSAFQDAQKPRMGIIRRINERLNRSALNKALNEVLNPFGE